VLLFFDKQVDGFIRLLDFQDLAQTIVQFIEDGNKQNLLTTKGKLDDMMDSITIQIVQDYPHTSGDLTKEHPFFYVKQNESLLNAVHLFTKKLSNVRVYRICVLSSDATDIRSKSAFVGILAQSDAIKFVHSKLKSPSVSCIAKKSLKELHLGDNKPVCVKSNKSVFEGLKTMLKHSYNSVAIVEENTGKLTGNLTSAHIQYLFRTRLYSAMTLTVNKFLSKISKEEKQNKDESDTTFFSVSLETSLADCIKRVVDLRLHRVWVVDSENRPTGVVTLRDMLSVLTPQWGTNKTFCLLFLVTL